MKSLREYIDLMNSLDQKQPVNEGAVGAAIGGGLGGIAGSALGPLGIVGGAAAGAALGSKAGDFLANIFDKGSQTYTPNVAISKDKNIPTGFVNATTGDAIKPPEKGFGTKVKQALGSDVDDLGVAKNGYKKYPEMVFNASSSLKPGGKYAEIIQQVTEKRGKDCGLPVTIRGTWDYQGATLVLHERDQWMQGFWADMATTPGGGNIYHLFAPLGWKGVGHSESLVNTKFGNANGHAEKYDTADGPMVVYETTQMVPLKLPDGQPGMHMLSVTFCGPETVWGTGARKAVVDLINSITLNGVTQLKG